MWLGNSKKLICIDQSRFYFSYIPKNSKMFYITLKYFTFFKNKLPAGWVAHIARDFLACYSCSYCSSMFWRTLFGTILISEKLMLFWRTFFNINIDERKIDDILVYFFELISMDKKIDAVSTCSLSNFAGKLVPIWGPDFNLTLKDTNLLSFWRLFLKSFWYIKN